MYTSEFCGDTNSKQCVREHKKYTATASFCGWIQRTRASNTSDKLRKPGHWSSSLSTGGGFRELNGD